MFSLVVADFNGDKRPEILTVGALESKVRLFVSKCQSKHMVDRLEPIS